MLPTDQTYGIQIYQYLSPHGEVNLIGHDMFAGSVGTGGKWGGYGYLIDLDNVFYRPLQNRDTRLKMNIQAADQDGEKDEYITEAGLMVIQEQTHGIIKGIFNY